MATRPGLEPRMRVSKTPVLPITPSGISLVGYPTWT